MAAFYVKKVLESGFSSFFSNATGHSRTTSIHGKIFLTHFNRL